MKDRIPYQVFENLGKLKNNVADIIKNYSQNMIKKITGFEYFIKAANAVVL